MLMFSFRDSFSFFFILQVFKYLLVSSKGCLVIVKKIFIHQIVLSIYFLLHEINILLLTYRKVGKEEKEKLCESWKIWY